MSGRRNPPRKASSASDSPAKSNGTESNIANGKTIRSTRSKTKSYKDEEDNDEIIESSDEDIKQIDKRSKLSSSSEKTTASTAKASASKIDMESLAKLESITGLSRSEAMQLLEASNNKLEKAVDLYFNNNDSSNSSTSNTKRQNTTTTTTSTNTTNMNGNKRSYNSDNSNDKCAAINEDDEDNVRAPIPQKIEKLLDYDPYALKYGPQPKRMRGAFDSFDISEEKKDISSSYSSKKQTLAAMYQPPIDLLYKGSFEASKIDGCDKNKWVMLNVQNQTDFNCQVLNRDVWKDETVKEIIRANFIFVQIYFDSIDGQKLLNYYQIKSYPFIGIIDPITGEKLMQFNISKLDPMIFCEKITNFLAEHEAPLKDGESPSKYLPPTHERNLKKVTSSLNNKGCEEVVHVDDDDIIEVNSNNNKLTNGKSVNSRPCPPISKSPKNFQNGLFKVDGTLKSFLNSKPKRAADIVNTLDNVQVKKEDDEEVKINDDDDEEPLKKTKKNKKLDDLFDNENSDDDPCVTSKDEYNKNKNNEKFNQTEKKIPIKEENNEKVITKQENLQSKNTENINVNKSNLSHQSTSSRYEDPNCSVRDCTIRLLFPNGDRLDFCTNKNTQLKFLIDYLAQKGYKKTKHELIERLMPTLDSKQHILKDDKELKNQSRNLFQSDSNLTLKELNLFPRTMLLVQES